MTIRTIVNDNVAIRCDGCREVIPGTPWRVNLLDIVAPEVAVGWTESTPVNPGPHQFHSDPACVRQLDGRARATGSAVAARCARSCARSRCPRTRRPGACATASTATTTSSSRPDPRSLPRPAARVGLRLTPLPDPPYTRALRPFRPPSFAQNSGVPSGPDPQRRASVRPRPRRRPTPARTPRPGRGEPPPGRGPRHPAPLGRRGPGSRLHHARRPPPVRAARPRAPHRRPAHRPARQPREPRREPGPPLRGLSTSLRGAPRRQASIRARPSRRRSASRIATSDAAWWTRWSGTSMRRAPAVSRPSARPWTSRRTWASGSRSTGSRSRTASRCSCPRGARSSRS